MSPLESVLLVLLVRISKRAELLQHYETFFFGLIQVGAALRYLPQCKDGTLSCIPLETPVDVRRLAPVLASVLSAVLNSFGPQTTAPVAAPRWLGTLGLSWQEWRQQLLHRRRARLPTKRNASADPTGALIAHMDFWLQPLHPAWRRLDSSRVAMLGPGLMTPDARPGDAARQINRIDLAPPCLPCASREPLDREKGDPRGALRRQGLPCTRCNAWVDLYYVPMRWWEVFRALLASMAHVHIEVAVSSVLHSLAAADAGENVWSGAHVPQVIDWCLGCCCGVIVSPTLLASHPCAHRVSLDDMAVRDTMLRLLSNVSVSTPGEGASDISVLPPPNVRDGGCRVVDPRTNQVLSQVGVGGLDATARTRTGVLCHSCSPQQRTWRPEIRFSGSGGDCAVKSGRFQNYDFPARPKYSGRGQLLTCMDCCGYPNKSASFGLNMRQ